MEMTMTIDIDKRGRFPQIASINNVVRDFCGFHGSPMLLQLAIITRRCSHPRRPMPSPEVLRVETREDVETR